MSSMKKKTQAMPPQQKSISAFFSKCTPAKIKQESSESDASSPATAVAIGKTTEAPISSSTKKAASPAPISSTKLAACESSACTPASRGEPKAVADATATSAFNTGSYGLLDSQVSTGAGASLSASLDANALATATTVGSAVAPVGGYADAKASALAGRDADARREDVQDGEHGRCRDRHRENLVKREALPGNEHERERDGNTLNNVLNDAREQIIDIHLIYIRSPDFFCQPFG